MKIYIVRSYDPCECDEPCNCIVAGVDAVYLSEELAKLHAKRLYSAYVDDFKVEDAPVTQWSMVAAF